MSKARDLANLLGGGGTGVPTFSGSGAIKVPGGTSNQRPSGSEGMIRYNSDTGLVENYNNAGWQGIDAPPTVNSVAGTILSSTNSTLTINGSNFKSGAVVYIEGAAVSNVSRALATTYVSANQLTATTNANNVSFVAGASFNVKVVNTSGLAYVLDSAGTVDTAPVFTYSSGTIATIYDSSRTTYGSVSVVATDADGDTISYSITSGSLPTGMSLGSSTGLITGTPNAVSSDTSSTFTVRASTTNGATADRSYTITIKAPVVQTFNSSTTFTAPISTTLRVLGVGGGGSGGAHNSNCSAGGGGAGGMFDTTYSVVSGQNYTVTVGNGGAGQSPDNAGQDGQNSVFANLIAYGGGGGGGGSNFDAGRAGGSSGGDAHGNVGNGVRNTPNPTQPNSATGGFGGRGGQESNSSPGWGGGGGGGAGGDGGAGTANNGGNGGAGKTSDITGASVYYAGGGGGGTCTSGGTAGSGGIGGGGSSSKSGTAGSGTNGLGGGGGAGSYISGGFNSGAGGRGVVIVRY